MASPTCSGSVRSRAAASASRSLALGHAVEGAGAGDGLDPAGVRADGRLGDDGDGADHAEGADVGAAAQLDRVGPGPDHPDPLAVLVAEEGQGAHGLGLGLGGLLHDDRRVGQHVGVGQAVTAAQLLGGDGAVVAEVEAQPVGGHQRALLADLVAEHGPQGGVEQVGAGVVAAQGVTPGPVDGGQGVLAGEDLAGDRGPVGGQAGQGRHGVVDEGGARLGDDGADVAHLAAALGVERGAVEEDLHLAGALGVVVGQHGHHPGRRRVAVGRLADEDGPALGVEHRPVGLVAGRGPPGAGRGPGLGPLALHGRPRSRSRSTADPASSAISTVSSTGKP